MTLFRHILVVGSGSTAGYLLGTLSNTSERDGFRVSGLVREYEASALRQSALRIEGRGSLIRAMPEVMADPLNAPEADLILLATKSEHARAVLRKLRRNIERGATVLTIAAGVPWWLPSTNGALGGAHIESIDPEGELHSSIPVGCIVAGVADFICDRPAPDIVRHYCGRKMIIGSASNNLTHLWNIQNLFAGCSLECSITTDIQSILWSNLIDIGSINPISILTGTTSAAVVGSRTARLILTRIMREIESVGSALGLGPFGATEDRLDALTKISPPKVLFFHEIERGLEFELELELDVVLQAVVEIGDRIGIATPTLGFLCDLARLKAIFLTHQVNWQMDYSFSSKT